MKNDMLNNFSSVLRDMPYSVPEGYFDGLKKELAAIASDRRTERDPAGKIWSYVSIAAALFILVTAGTFILERRIGSEGMTYEDYVVYSDMFIDHEYDEDDLHIIENEVRDEDIVEYLIYNIGVTAEVIEQSK